MTELGNIPLTTHVPTQAALDAVAAAAQPLDADLTAIAALAPADDAFIQRKSGVWVSRTVAQVLTDLAAPGTTFQPLDSDLTAIAAIAPANDDVVQRKAGAWTNRTMAQLIADLAALGTTFQPLDSDLTALAGLAIAADKLPYGSGSHTMALADFTAAARALLDDADASAMLTTLGVSTFIKTLLDDADAATARATLGISGGALHSAYAQLSYTVSSGTDGGTSTSGSWQTRPLNTEDFDPGGIVSLSSNQFVLAAGTYYVDGGCFFENPSARIKLRIRNITDSTTALVGMGVWIPSASNAGIPDIRGRFTLSGTKTLELQYYVQSGASSDGLGVSYSATGEVEKYADLSIWKEA